LINIIREKILHKGYANRADIRKFIPCGSVRSQEIFDQIRNEVKEEGKLNLEKVVLSRRLLPYIGLTEKQVISYAEKEKADAATSTNNKLNR
jgi:hypothetical protein